MPDTELEAARLKYMGKLVRGTRRDYPFRTHVGIVQRVYRGEGLSVNEVFLALHTEVNISIQRRSILIHGEGA